MPLKPKTTGAFSIKRSGTLALKRKKADPPPQKSREGEAQADTPTTLKPPPT